MKNTIYKLLTSSLLLWTFFPALYGGTVSSFENILFPGGRAVLEKEGSILFNASFRKGTPPGRIAMNYLGKTAFQLQNFKGRESLVITPAKDKTSAWGFRMAPFAVQGGKEFLLEMDLCGTVSMLKGAGRRTFSNRYIFLDREGRLCGEEYFYYESLSDSWITVKVTGQIPRQAVKMVLQIGGSPTIGKGGFRAYSKILVRQFDRNTSSRKSGSFVSRPIPLEKNARMSWKAQVKPGTTLSFRIQTAPDLQGKPGKWSAWKKYDNKAIVTRDSWIRYEAQFRSTNGKSAVLESVRIGSFTDRDFTAVKDDHGPVVTRVSPSPVMDPMAKVVFRVEDETAVNFNTLRCYLNKSKTPIKLTRKGNLLTYTPEKPMWNRKDKRKELNSFTFHMEDIYGHKGVMNEFCYIGKPHTGNKVSTRKDGMMLINGKPFFPLGFYSGKPHADQMPVLKAHGVNFLQSFDGGKVAADLVSLAEKYDIKLCIRYWLTAHRNSKAVIGYYTADDSRRFSDYVLRGTYNQVRSYAPGVFRGHSEMPFQSYSSYYGSKIWTSDVFISQLYPISDKPAIIRCGAQRLITDMQTMVRDRKNSCNPSHCILAGPQAFAEKPTWTRYPTAEEIKLMGYLSVIHGANGVVYFSYPSARRSPGEVVYKAVLKTLKELSDLKEVFLSGKTAALPLPVVIKGAVKDKDGNDSINMLAKVLGKDLYILAANSAASPITVRFRGIQGKKVFLPFEKRSLSIQKGTLTDTFPAYGVHVYKITLP